MQVTDGSVRLSPDKAIPPHGSSRWHPGLISVDFVIPIIVLCPDPFDTKIVIPFPLVRKSYFLVNPQRVADRVLRGLCPSIGSSCNLRSRRRDDRFRFLRRGRVPSWKAFQKRGGSRCFIAFFVSSSSVSQLRNIAVISHSDPPIVSAISA